MISERLSNFDRQTEPLVEYYRNHGGLWDVDAGAEVESVTKAVLKILEGCHRVAQLFHTPLPHMLAHALPHNQQAERCEARGNQHHGE